MNTSYVFTTKRELIETARYKAKVSTINEKLICQLNEKDAHIAELEETLIEMSDRSAVME